MSEILNISESTRLDSEISPSYADYKSSYRRLDSENCSKSSTATQNPNSEKICCHICCSVDSHYFLQKLREKYPNSEISGYFFNPNIHPKTEHDLRYNDVKRSCEMLNIELFLGEYELENWLDGVKGLEQEPEKGARCVKCFDIRLIKTAQFARKNGFEIFTTTLLSSPMKEREILFAQGEKIAMANDLEFIKIDVRSNGGTQEQSKLAKDDKLYRQNYCGCEFALNMQRQKQGKSSLELIENLGAQILPASNEERLATFQKRENLEKASKNYALAKSQINAWRVVRNTAQIVGFENLNSEMRSKIINVASKDGAVKIYALANSAKKANAKTGAINWINTQIQKPQILEKILRGENLQNLNSVNVQICIGVCDKDDSIFLDLGSFNVLCETNYKSLREVVKNPPSFELENAIRILLAGLDAVNPIIVVEDKITQSLKINIDSFTQSESVFRIYEQI